MKNYTDFEYPLKVIEITKLLDGKHIIIAEIIPCLVVEAIANSKLKIPTETQNLYAHIRIHDNSCNAIVIDFVN